MAPIQHPSLVVQSNMCHYKTEDECEADNGGCEQICTNTFLSFNCSCRGGYTLNDDGYTCSGNIATSYSSSEACPFLSGFKVIPLFPLQTSMNV